MEVHLNKEKCRQSCIDLSKQGTSWKEASACSEKSALWTSAREFLPVRSYFLDLAAL